MMHLEVALTALLSCSYGLATAEDPKSPEIGFITDDVVTNIGKNWNSLVSQTYEQRKLNLLKEWCPSKIPLTIFIFCTNSLPNLIDWAFQNHLTNSISLHVKKACNSTWTFCQYTFGFEIISSQNCIQWICFDSYLQVAMRSLFVLFVTTLPTTPIQFLGCGWAVQTHSPYHQGQSWQWRTQGMLTIFTFVVI